jgi:membrane protease YdiL (CAAX protease family)
MKQLTTYFGLTYLISWIIWLPLYGHIFGLDSLLSLPFQHAIGGLGPLVAAIIATWLLEKEKGVKQLLCNCLQMRPLVCFGIALLSPFLLAIIAMIMGYMINKSPMDLVGLMKSKEFPQFTLPTSFIYNLVFFGFGEEVGWRGFALPRFQNKFNALTSSIILTVFWALWHWPLFFYRPGYTSMDIAGILGWVFSLLTGSILLTWLFNSSKGSILVCAVFHSTIDIAFTADLADKSIINYMGFLITVWGVLTILIYKPKNLSRIVRWKIPTQSN